MQNEVDKRTLCKKNTVKANKKLKHTRRNIMKKRKIVSKSKVNRKQVMKKYSQKKSKVIKNQVIKGVSTSSGSIKITEEEQRWCNYLDNMDTTLVKAVADPNKLSDFLKKTKDHEMKSTNENSSIYKLNSEYYSILNAVPGCTIKGPNKVKSGEIDNMSSSDTNHEVRVSRSNNELSNPNTKVLVSKSKVNRKQVMNKNLKHMSKVIKKKVTEGVYTSGGSSKTINDDDLCQYMDNVDDKIIQAKKDILNISEVVK